MAQYEIIQYLKSRPSEWLPLSAIQNHFNVGKGHYIKQMQVLRKHNLVDYVFEENTTLRRNKEFYYKAK